MKYTYYIERPCFDTDDGVSVWRINGATMAMYCCSSCGWNTKTDVDEMHQRWLGTLERCSYADAMKLIFTDAL